MQRQDRYIATIDPLTGFYNRNAFYKKMEKLMKTCQDEEFVLIYTNLQDFKLVNELFGIERGDEILSSYAEILKKPWRADAICSRIEDDHFIVCIKKEDYNEDIIRNIIELTSRLIGSNTFRLQVYVGVYEIMDHNMAITAMCDRGRMALASVKGDYVIRIGYYKDDLRKNVIYEKALVSEFKDALARGDFKMYLQAQADQKGHIDGAEALVRWEHPKKGMIMPGVFIDLFERTGTIV